MEYKLKRGYTPDIERIRDLLTECFGTEIKEEDGKLKTSYGVLKEITVWINNKKLGVETVADNSGAADDLILDTNKRFRTFLDKGTGYTSKDRVKNAKKEVTGE
ncbi:hypothetical protein MmiEs2_03670 [Methanimicrococcus stummii]|uniref:DUF5611 domain-containing protein n=1 Tax=Methanimicrococcus stummii TaxID=3028294 RepID=A0AA96V8J0_9EURY|nr:DUF5611 family protein [Methanimicrococcus sp. Es2]WNY28183.1 hypothetical protein MmiEs2_03670 [Methanimicrococcus sp. Es2]